MRRTWVAYAAIAVAIATSWCVLLLWAAVVDWHAPVSPVLERHFAGSEFRAIFGSAHARDGRLHVESAGEDFSSLQSTTLADLEADQFPILSYRFEKFPRTLELSLVFRTTENPDDVQTISLPWPGSGVSTFDLGHVAGWKGTIIELGFAQFATAQNVPPASGFKPFDLVGAQLSSDSWRGAVAALATDWFGAWPWSQRSVHALGREGDTPRDHSAVLTSALAAAIAIGWCMFLPSLRGRRLLPCVLVCVALAWLALDLRWQSGLVQRLLATRTLYAGLAWPQRARIVGDADIEQAADEIRGLIRGEPAQTRILVESGSGYQTLRLIWHLLPLNVAPLTAALPLHAAIPDGALIVFYDSDAWKAKPSVRKLLASSPRAYGTGVIFGGGFDASPLVMFRYHDAR